MKISAVELAEAMKNTRDQYEDDDDISWLSYQLFANPDTYVKLG